MLLLLLLFSTVVSRTELACSGAGFYPDPASCTSFYRCVDAHTRYQFVCAAGTKYDQTLGMCNHDQLVQCHVTKEDIFVSSGGISMRPSGDTIESSGTSTEPSEGSTEPSGDSMVASGGSTGASGGSMGASGASLEASGSSMRPSVDNMEPLGSSNGQSAGNNIVISTTEVSEGQISSMKVSTPSTPSTTTQQQPIGTTSSSSQEHISASNNPPSATLATHSPTISSEDLSTPEVPNTQTQPTNPQQSIEPEANIPAGDGWPILPPVVDPPYSVSSNSIYPCSQPGYYEEMSSCREFYVCREVGPGVLSADRIFRCPDRYLFDTQTHLCQREHKATCHNQSTLFYTALNYLVVQLKEEDIDGFFKQSLTLALHNYRASTRNNNPDQELPLFYSFPT